MRFVASSDEEAGRCSKTRKFVSSANFASRTLDAGPKSSVDMAYAEISLVREDSVGACVMRWMCRCVGAAGFERAMCVDMVSVCVEG